MGKEMPFAPIGRRKEELAASWAECELMRFSGWDWFVIVSIDFFSGVEFELEDANFSDWVVIEFWLFIKLGELVLNETFRFLICLALKLFLGELVVVVLGEL